MSLEEFVASLYTAIYYESLFELLSYLMALIRTSVLDVRPESSLSIALNDFRSILTEEQRTHFVALLHRMLMPL